MLGAVVLYVVLGLRFGWNLRELSWDRLDEFLVAIERRAGRVGLCAMLALVFLGLAMLYVRLDTHCRFLGGWYALMTQDPFDFTAESEVGFRRFTPTISYLFGLTGRNIIVTNLIFAFSLLFCSALYFTKHGSRPGDAVFITGGLALSLVTLTTMHCGGYTDSTTYLFVFLMWWFRRRPLLFYVFFVLGLLNREAVLFLVPWFAVLRWQHSTSWKRWLIETVVAYGIIFAAYLEYREFIAAQANVRYSMDYYLGHLLQDPLARFRQTLYYHGLGVFSVFKLLWVFPILGFAAFWRDKRWSHVLAFVFIFVGSYVQLLIAQDTSRMMTMSFMMLPISLRVLLEEDRWRIRDWMGWLFLANLAVPTVYTAGVVVEIWQPYWRHLLIRWLN